MVKLGSILLNQLGIKTQLTKDSIKIYGNHKLSKPIKISGISLSKGAEKSVIDAGGVVEN